MEPFPKRQRLYASARPAFSQSFEDQHAYYDELGDDLEYPEDEEEYDEEVGSEQGAAYDPDADLQQKRARLDHKLKSTFESIFEKYERDFDGVGDEIDLETGEIVVNNGHISQMLDEHDAGDLSNAPQALRGYTEEPDELPTSPLDETDAMELDDEEDEEDEQEDEGDFAEDSEEVDDEMEDDLILRGFAQANRFPQASPELELGRSHAPATSPRMRRQGILLRPAAKTKLPSRDDILAQFGPRLGPQIVEYVSKQRVQKESLAGPAWRAPELPRKVLVAENLEPAWRVPTLPSSGPSKLVEPAWRVPDLPSAAPVRRPVHNPITIPPEKEPLPSPEASTSVWAVARHHSKKPSSGSDNNLLPRGGNKAAKQPYRPRPSDSMLHQSAYEQAQQARTEPSTWKYLAFTAKDDDLTQKWASNSRKLGLQPHWTDFAAEYPHHSASSWQQRHDLKSRNLSTNEGEETELSQASTEERSFQPTCHHSPKGLNHDIALESRARPVRIRKPAQTDPRIMSWNEAVVSIESLDPVLHAGIMEDARISNQQPRQSSSSVKRGPRQSQAEREMSAPGQLQEITPPNDDNGSCDKSPTRSSLAVELTPEQEDALIPGAPCPHADCRVHPAILYKLQRRENEDLSEMCLHLFRVHHTTPFPCRENGCSRTGEQGYFMQLDLVKHVRLTHKSLSALQRLQGRVDSDLLGQQVALAHGTSLENDSPPRLPVNCPRGSDFMSPQRKPVRNVSSSQPLSVSDPDRTLTPRDVAGTSTSTPRTSVSSLKVNRSSAASTVLRDVSASQDREIMDSRMGSSSYLEESSQCRARPTTARRYSDESLLRAPRGASSGGSLDFRNSCVSSKESLPPRSQTATGGSMGLSQSLGGPSRASSGKIEGRQIQDLTYSRPRQSSLVVEVLPSPSIALLPETGNLQDPNESPVTTIGPASRHVKEKPSAAQNLTRNVVHSTYEFSDDEPNVEPTTVFAQASPVVNILPENRTNVEAKAPAVAASVETRPEDGSSAAVEPDPIPSTVIVDGPSITSTKQKPRPRTLQKSTINRTLATPATTKPPKSIWAVTGRTSRGTRPLATPAAKTTRPRAYSEGIDELSMGAEELIMLSSKFTTDALPIPQLGIKHEESLDLPVTYSVPAAKKRKLDVFRNGGLHEQSAAKAPVQAPRAVPGAGFASLTSEPTIKTEHESLPYAGRPIMPKRRGRPPKPKGNLAGDSSSSKPLLPHTAVSMPIRTSTPLLDLTPVRNKRANAERMREIEDSEAEVSSPESPLQRRMQVPRGQGETGSGTPMAKRRWNVDSLRTEGVAILVKTPGGTMRRCGVDGFACGRSFCFRCSGSGSGKAGGA